MNEKNNETITLDDLQLPSGDCPNCGASPDKREIAGDEKYPEYETTIRVLKCECGSVIHETFTLTKIEIVRIDDKDN